MAATQNSRRRRAAVLGLWLGAGAAGAQPPVQPAGALDLANLPRPGAFSRERGTSVPPRALLSNADGFWRYTEPAPAMAETWLQAHNDLCARTGADACLVVHRGRIAAEWYRAGLPDSPVRTASAQAVTALVAVALLGDRRLRSLDEPVCRFVTSWCDVGRDRATVRHLLTMTSGLAPRTRAPAVGTVDDMNAFVTGLRPAARPGTRLMYSNEGAQLLSPVLDRAAGEPVQRYAARRLFGPLGMRDTRFAADARGHAATYANLFTTPRDLARLGVLVLQGGRWEGRPLVPAALVDSLVRPSQPFNPLYGLGWWRLGGPGSVGYVARGQFATNLYAFPQQALVVVRVQNGPLPGDPDRAYEAAAVPLVRAVIRGFAPGHWH